MYYLIVKNRASYEEYPVIKKLKLKEALCEIEREQLSVSERGKTASLQPFSWGQLETGEIFYFYRDWEKRFARNEQTTISCQNEDINVEGLQYKIILEKDQVVISALENSKVKDIYHNGQKIDPENSTLTVKEGDELFLGGIKLIIFPDQLVIIGNHEKIASSLLEVADRKTPFEGFPVYKRSPRIIKRIPTDRIEISKPPQKSNMKKGSLVQAILPSLVMLCVTIAISILMKRGLFILMSVAGMAMTMIFSTTKFINDRKEQKEINAKREQMYSAYLLRKRREIYEQYTEECEAYSYNYPEIEEIEAMVNSCSDRIYERSANDDDFLRVSVGKVVDRVSFDVKIAYNELSMEDDVLEKEANDIKNEFSTIENKPVLVDLKRDHLGLVGEKDVVHEQLKLLVAQMTFEQSYHDLEIITVYDEKYEDDFAWMRWYPHLRLREINVVGNINTERKRDQVLGSIHQIIKERKQRVDESKKSHRFLPHFLFIIDEPKLIIDHSVMEYLDKEGDALGFSIIYTTNLRANLPENIGTIVLLENSEQGVLLLDEKEIAEKRFRLNHAAYVDFEQMARNLSVLEHKQGIVSQIPESITFFEMYKVSKPEELNIEKRWASNQSHKSLAVPLGVRAEEDYVRLNLHEKAHGPHGLVAGTTGSGKSEIIQSYILSLAVNFHPYEVGFLLIDYKGGGMAGLFENLPHLLGTITNLDGAESMRAMASIKSELARRQRYFQKYGVNHINAYNILFKNGEAEEPMPHLFLISDEFAELKKEQPEFMSELVSAARIGRSLGVHLILATQKPTGVVDDQIWTNSKFKLALKVQNESDSKEIIKTPDAASITQPGRAYLQVGNNEIYELFQSAWSGAAYKEDAQEEVVDDRVYVINDLGQGELVNEDLSGDSEEMQLQETQLDATINYIHSIFEREGSRQVKRPWLPPLKEQILTPALIQNGEVAEEITQKDTTELDLKIPLGLMDIPEEQDQREYCIDLQKDGNFLYMASSGYGKSVLLTTAVLSLALVNRVSNLNFYILDFGNSALIPLNGLPHTADYITVDAQERFNKFINVINDEIAERKKLLADLAVQNFYVYNQVSETPLKAIVIAVDNFDVIKEFGFEIEDFFSKISRDGAGLGIYVMGTTTRSNGVKYATLNNFKIKIAGYTFEDQESNNFIGRSQHKPSEIKGRVLVKEDSQINFMQCYVMARFSSDVKYTNGVKALVSEINRLYPDERAPRIPVLPEVFVSTMMGDYAGTPNQIMLGLDKEKVELMGFDRTSSPFTIVGEAAKGKTNALKIIMNQIKDQGDIFLFDSKSMELYSYKPKNNITYMDNPEELPQFIETFSAVIQARSEAFRKAMAENTTLKPKEIYAAMAPCYLVIDDVDDFIDFTKSNTAAVAQLLKNAAGAGVSVIMTCHSGKMKGFDEITKYVKSSVDGLVLGSQGTVNIFPFASLKEIPEFKDGCLFRGGVYRRLRIPRYTE